MGRYKVHRLNLKMMTNPQTLEDFPNGLRGEVVAIIPNLTTNNLNIRLLTFCWSWRKTVSGEMQVKGLLVRIAGRL